MSSQSVSLDLVSFPVLSFDLATILPPDIQITQWGGWEAKKTFTLASLVSLLAKFESASKNEINLLVFSNLNFVSLATPSCIFASV